MHIHSMGFRLSMFIVSLFRKILSWQKMHGTTNLDNPIIFWVIITLRVFVGVNNHMSTKQT